MNQDKPSETLAGQECPFCAQGKLELCQIVHQVETPDEPTLGIPNVWVDRCAACGEMIFPPESSNYIEQVIAEQAEQLSLP